MQLAEPVAVSWKASLRLGFSFSGRKTTLSRKTSDGPLVVQKPLYPEGPAVCHAIIVHPPGGIAGGDELALEVDAPAGSAALLTTPGAAKWYRSAGPLATQQLAFNVSGTLEWLPRETIAFRDANARLGCRIDVRGQGVFIGWEVLCLGRRGSGERFDRGRLDLRNAIRRDGRLLFAERGRLEGGERLLHSPVGLGGMSVCGTMLAVAPDFPETKALAPDCLALTRLPGVLVARYLGDCGEEALAAFTRLWATLRPVLLGREATEPRIWRT
ncbi:MAG: urease accessory protein UreD [Betaproteobacteria bacterium]